MLAGEPEGELFTEAAVGELPQAMPDGLDLRSIIVTSAEKVASARLPAARNDQGSADLSACGPSRANICRQA